MKMSTGKLHDARNAGRSLVIPRRTVLRGLLAGGVAVALPLPRLVGMLDGNGEAYADGTALSARFLTWFFGNGVDPAKWVPAATGTGDAWSLSPNLMPLADYKDYVSVVSGFDVKVPYIYAHKSSAAAVLSGAQAVEGGDVSMPTVDQLIAKKISAGTAFPGGIHVGICNVTGAGALDFNISFNGPNAPNPPEYNPVALFQQLLQFSDTTQEPDPSLFRRRRLLDAIREDAKALEARLGKEDKVRLEQHLEGVAQLEKQIDQALNPVSCGSPVDPDVVYPDRGPDGKITRGRCQAFADLIAFAFSCELTNVASHVFSCAACHGAYEEAGLGNVTFHEDYGHRLSPAGTAAAEEGFNNGVAYAMTCVADLLERLHKTPDGPGKNLLDNTAIYVTSCVSLPWEHRMDDYPLLVLGKGAGKLKGNVHHRGAGDNASKVPFTLLQAFGTAETSFGSAEGLTSEVVPELLV
jgi:hypothetical protein